MKTQKYRIVGVAEHKADCYQGKNCNRIGSDGWHGWMDGDRDDGEIGDKLTLRAVDFPRGTRITIQEPECSVCREPRSMCEQMDRPKCRAAWVDWDVEHYS